MEEKLKSSESSQLILYIVRVYLFVVVFILLTCGRVFALEDFLMGISTKHISIAYLYIGKEREIFSQRQKPGWFLLSNPSIGELRQLSGKAVTVGTLGSGSHLATVEILRKA